MLEESLAAVLSQLAKSTTKSFAPSDFTKRLRIQKAIYLLKALGYGPASKYAFGSYVRGPYSPQLANDYYALPWEVVLKTNPARIPSEFLSPVADAVRRGNDFLEAAATIHIFWIRNPGQKKSELLENVCYVKPELARHLEEAWAFLIKNRLLPAYT